MGYRNILQRGLIAVILLLALGGQGCGGCSGSGSSSTTDTSSLASSFTVPDEISVIPATSTAQGSLSGKSVDGLKSAVMSLSKAATDADTDYSTSTTERYIEEHTLEQFDILEQIFDAINQTSYANEVCNGTYVTKVAWEEKEGSGGVEVDRKKLEEWIVRSDWTDAGGTVTCDSGTQERLRLRAWIEETDEGGTHLIKAEFVIITPAERNDDGSYANYGEWTANVKFGDGNNDFFAASSTLEDNDNNIIMIHERFAEGFPGALPGEASNLTVDMSAILHRGLTTGYGKVRHPDWEALYGPEADLSSLTSMPMNEATYAYNADVLAVKSGENDVGFKNRNSSLEMTHRYGVFNAETGVNVLKSKSFGFPVRFATADGERRHAYYGAWQGRHELWSHGGQDEQVAKGTTVIRDDIPSDEPEESYTVGSTFHGTLTQRTYAAASLSDILNIPVEIWIDEFFQLIFSNCDGDGDSEWCECDDFDWSTNQCRAGELATSAFDLDRLTVGQDDERKSVWIDGFDEATQRNKNFVYTKDVGFYEAEQQEGNFGIKFVSTGVPLNTANVRGLHINIGGSIFVEYKGTSQGWVEKELTAFDMRTWQPTFNADGDKSYSLPEGRELYIHMEGINYVVTRTGNDYNVQHELQTVANPNSAVSLIPDGTVFRNRWDGSESASTYSFVTDATSENHLLLVYRTVGGNDVDSQGEAEAQVGAVVTEGLWGLVATIEGQEKFFNWEYSSDNGGWGSVTYLLNTDGTYKLLDDPIAFEPITAINGAGEEKALSLRFDGWMHGLPDYHHELEKNDWVISDDIKDKIVNLAAGMQLTESITGVKYLLKPLEIGLFLESIANPGNLDLTAAEGLDLTIVPDFVEHGMENKPACEQAKYSEGVCIDDLIDGVCAVDSGCQ